MPPHLVLLLKRQGVWRIVPVDGLLAGGVSMWAQCAGSE